MGPLWSCFTLLLIINASLAFAGLPTRDKRDVDHVDAKNIFVGATTESLEKQPTEKELEELCIRTHNNTAFIGAEPYARIRLNSASECRQHCVDTYPTCVGVVFYYVHNKSDNRKHICYLFDKNSINDEVALIAEKPSSPLDMVRSLEIVINCHEFDPFPPVEEYNASSSDRVPKNKRDVSFGQPIRPTGSWSPWLGCSADTRYNVRYQPSMYGYTVQRAPCRAHIGSTLTTADNLLKTQSIAVAYPPIPYVHPSTETNQYVQIMADHQKQADLLCCSRQRHMQAIPASSAQNVVAHVTPSTECRVPCGPLIAHHEPVSSASYSPQTNVVLQSSHSGPDIHLFSIPQRVVVEQQQPPVGRLQQTLVSQEPILIQQQPPVETVRQISVPQQSFLVQQQLPVETVRHISVPQQAAVLQQLSPVETVRQIPVPQQAFVSQQLSPVETVRQIPAPQQVFVSQQQLPVGTVGQVSIPQQPFVIQQQSLVDTVGQVSVPLQPFLIQQQSPVVTVGQVSVPPAVVPEKPSQTGSIRLTYTKQQLYPQVVSSVYVPAAPPQVYPTCQWSAWHVSGGGVDDCGKRVVRRTRKCLGDSKCICYGPSFENVSCDQFGACTTNICVKKK